jgi:hypothetical protein
MCKGHEYNRALINRGRLTAWFDERAVAAWHNAEPVAGPGALRSYSDLAIAGALIFHIGLSSQFTHPAGLGLGAGCLSKTFVGPPTSSFYELHHNREADGAEDRTQASHVADTPQTLSP